MLLTIVIPVYNSGIMLRMIADELLSILSKYNVSYELILVNDCSTDDTRTVIEDLSLRNDCIKGIHLTKNVGQFTATLIGTKYAKGDYILHMDDDMEHPPAEIIKLLDALVQNKQYQIVFGMTKDKYKIKDSIGFPEFRNAIINLLWGKYPTDSFRIFRREMVFDGDNYLITYPMFEVYLKHHVKKNKVGYISVERNTRIHGKSGYSILKKIKLFFKLTPNFLFKNYKNLDI